jgi:hypothetical protein
MTSTEFAAKYRLLKNVATRGARSFLAQQVALGRMVMVHYLESETPRQRAAMLARLDALRPPARDKLLEVADVDGTPVAVTLFISSFVDFATWLDAVSPASAAHPATPAAPAVAGEFTRAFSKAELPKPGVIPVAAREAPPKREVQRKAPGEFTRIFGKVDEPSPPPIVASADAPHSPTAPKEHDAATLIMDSAKAPASPPPAPAPAALPQGDSASSFTAIFGQRGQAAPPPPVTPAPAQGPGEFTQLFQRMSSNPGGTSPAPFATPPASAPEVPLPFAAAPRADVPPFVAPPQVAPPSVPMFGAPPLAAPSLGAPSLGGSPVGAPTLGAPPVGAPSLGSIVPPAAAAPLAASLGAILPAPMLGNHAAPVSISAPRLPDIAAMPNVSPPSPSPGQTSGSSAPPPPWGTPAAPPQVGSSMFAGGVQSEFTRILGKVTVAPPPPISIQPPTGASAQPSASRGKSMLPLIIALNVVLLLTIAIVAYFVLRA